MPTTVPNRPMNGAADPIEASEPSLDSRARLARQRHIHCLVDAHLQSDRRFGAALEGFFPFAHRRHEDRAHARGLAVRQRPVEFLKRLPRPEDLFELVQLARKLAEGHPFVRDNGPGPDRCADRPSMTSLTTKPACMKSDQSVTSLVAASPTCSIHIPSNPYARSIYRAAKTSLLPGIQKCAIAAFSLLKVFSRPILVKGWRTRCAQSYRFRSYLVMVKAWLGFANPAVAFSKPLNPAGQHHRAVARDHHRVLELHCQRAGSPNSVQYHPHCHHPRQMLPPVTGTARR
jgi:hypothetical protein